MDDNKHQSSQQPIDNAVLRKHLAQDLYNARPLNRFQGNSVDFVEVRSDKEFVSCTMYSQGRVYLRSAPGSFLIFGNDPTKRLVPERALSFFLGSKKLRS